MPLSSRNQLMSDKACLAVICLVAVFTFVSFVLSCVHASNIYTGDDVESDEYSGIMSGIEIVDILTAIISFVALILLVTNDDASVSGPKEMTSRQSEVIGTLAWVFLVTVVRNIVLLTRID